MTNETMSPLRRRMIEDMTIRNFGPKTQHYYVRSVRNLTVFLGRSPDTASNEDVRRFQLHLASDGISAASMNSTVSGLRFFFRVTLGRSNIASHLPFVRQPHKLPIVLSPEEVSRFLEAAPSLKYKAAFSVAYGAASRNRETSSGLRTMGSLWGWRTNGRWLAILDRPSVTWKKNRSPDTVLFMLAAEMPSEARCN